MITAKGLGSYFYAINLHAWNCQSSTTYNFCHECARDLISFQVDQKYEMICENDKNIDPKLRLWSLKTVFRHPVCILLFLLFDWSHIDCGKQKHPQDCPNSFIVFLATKYLNKSQGIMYTYNIYTYVDVYVHSIYSYPYK